MPSKVHAISKPSEELALSYGKNVSRGIAAMGKKIEEQAKEIEQLTSCGGIK